MTWTLDTIGQFYESQLSNPAEYLRLSTADPAGRMWASLRQAEQAFTEAKTEKQALGSGDFSIAPDRTAELESIMTSSLDRRCKALAGIQAACVALGDAPEPTVRSLQYRLDYCRRVRKPGEVPGLTATIATLEGIATTSFQ
jgi:hypothetical protein